MPTDGSADSLDSDGDARNNWEEWLCLTDPTNVLSVLRLLSVKPAGAGLAVHWQSVPGINYFIESSTNLSAIPPFTTVATNLPGEFVSTTYLDTNAVPAARRFYRVGVGQ